MARLIDVRVPDMGNFSEVAIIDVLVKPGDAIEREASLITLETEKATMDVPSDVTGVIEKMHVAKGGKVSPGDVVATVRVEGDAAAAAPAAAAAAPASAKPATTAPASAPPAAPAAPGSAPPDAKNAAPTGANGAGNGASAPAAASIPGGRTDLAPINEAGFSKAHAGPSVRRFARELGVDLSQVTGTGFKSRVTHDDVKAFVKKALTGGAGGAVAKGGGAGLPAV